VVVLLVALLVALPATERDFQKGKAAYKRENYAVALQRLRPLAEQGYAKAQNFLGFIYQIVEGVPQDYTEAVKWYSKAAERGNPQAQSNLGSMYYRGLGVSKNGAEAVKWYRKAAEQGLAKSQYLLGLLYAKGHGVPRDIVLAHMWFSLAAANGSKNGSKYRDKAATFMTPAQISEAQKLSRDWLHKHKKQ